MKNKIGIFIIVSLFILSCGEDNTGDKAQENETNDSETSDPQTLDTETDDTETGENSVENIDSEILGGCTALFGNPMENTGISETSCNTTCDCEGSTFEAPQYSNETIERLAGATSLTDNSELTEDPYETPEDFPYVENTVCAIKFETDNTEYQLKTFDSTTDAADDGWIVTHDGNCGKCSDLYNLSVYLKYDDMTAVVRQCAIDNLNSEPQDNIDCLSNLGFDLPCAQIWYYNSKHTRKLCFQSCIAAINDPYHNLNGSLNECLQCDEDDSGNIFKAVAGRTRRNSGLPSAICRPCDQISKITHNYW